MLSGALPLNPRGLSLFTNSMIGAQEENTGVAPSPRRSRRLLLLPCYWPEAENLPRTTVSGVPVYAKWQIAYLASLLRVVKSAFIAFGMPMERAGPGPLLDDSSRGDGATVKKTRRGGGSGGGNVRTVPGTGSR